MRAANGPVYCGSRVCVISPPAAARWRSAASSGPRPAATFAPARWRSIAAHSIGLRSAPVGDDRLRLVPAAELEQRAGGDRAQRDAVVAVEADLLAQGDAFARDLYRLLEAVKRRGQDLGQVEIGAGEVVEVADLLRDRAGGGEVRDRGVGPPRQARSTPSVLSAWPSSARAPTERAMAIASSHLARDSS